MDRTKAGISKSQLGFFDVVALPLFQSFATRFPDTEPLLAGLRDNYAYWRDDAERGRTGAAAAAAGHLPQQQGGQSQPVAVPQQRRQL
jgi:hypothetical protein